MKLKNDQYNVLRTLTGSIIQADIINKHKEIVYNDISRYIDRAVKFSGVEIDKEDYKKLFTDIEYQYKIIHTEDQVIFDDYDILRDWYHREEIKDNFFWNRYYNYLVDNSSLDMKSISRMDFTTLPQIMNCLSNPKEEFESKRLRRGLIIGDVQSGKTATYIGLICKAADAGYKVVILLAGITESLRKQTQERIDEGIIGFTKKKIGKVEKTACVGVGLDNKPLRATSFTSSLNDFVSNTDKIATSLKEHKSLVIFVIKKNVSVLQKLLNWLKDYNLDPVKQYVDQPMLLIDDEADNASVNTRKDETDPTRTNKLIRQICDLFKNATYVGFTATPFANVFIDPDSVDSMKRADLFPEHFIYVLPTPSSYIGANKIFSPGGEDHGNLIYIEDVDEPDYESQEYQDEKKEDPESLNTGTFYYKHMKEWHGILPTSLHQAILCFYLANVVRDLRGDIEKPRSMLVNMSRFVKVQKYIRDYVEEQQNAFLTTVNYDFSDDNKQNKSLPLYQELELLWRDNFSNILDISFERVVNKKALLDAVSNIQIMVVNGGKSSGKLDYKTNKSLRVIAVGGLALSRGLTLEGLLISYFYRNTATFDVLMQMGRWFGYRPHYEDLFRIWISKLSAAWYNEVAQASSELKKDLKHMNDQKLTPKDFGIKVRDYCDDLQITAANKMRTAANWLKFTYWGSIYDTPYLSRNIDQNKHNWESVSHLASTLFHNGYKFLFADQRKQSNEDVNSDSDKSRYFANVPKDIIVNFLSTINCSLMNPNFDTNQILEFINDPNNNGELEKWDVVFEGGDGNLFYDVPGLEKIRCISRSIYANGNVVQISSRRRLLGTREGKFTLTDAQIKEAEDKQRAVWRQEGANEDKAFPAKAYFEHLMDRKPMLIIMLIEANEDEDKTIKSTQTQKTKFKNFVKELGDNRLVAFAVGFPGRKGNIPFKKYKVNKIFRNMFMNEEDELEDEE